MQKRTRAPAIPAEVKRRVYERDKGRCVLCGRPGNPEAHVISRSQGGLIGGEGSLQTRAYTDREGNRRTAFEIVAERVFFAGPKESQKADPAAENAGQPNPEAYDDDFPF